MNLLLISLRLEYLKWIQSIKISLSKNLNYKINFLLMTCAPVLVLFIIKYNLWLSIYSGSGYQIIKGYSLSQMIHYQFWILVLEFFVRSHFFSINISQEIRHGKISCFLLYPFGFINYQLSLFFSDKIIQTFIGAFTVYLAFLFSWAEIPAASVLLKAGIFILMINAFWFFMQLLIGFLAFWLEETWGLNFSMRFIAAFLSGSILPLDLYPELFAKILLWTPFPCLTYIPVKILMGESVDMSFSLSLLFVWILALSILVRWVWKQGLKVYTGAGM